MHKLINKTVALVATFMLLSMNFIPATVFAANGVIQNAQTNEENIKFDVNINGSNQTRVNIQSEADLQISASVLNAGYLKDAKIILSDTNFELGEISNENIKDIKGNIIELNEVTAGEQINVSIPVKFNKEEIASEEDFYKESAIKLNATYVNEQGAEKTIEKTIIQSLEWVTEETEEISQKLIRYIKYENKTMVSFEIKDGIKDNTIPVISKNISIVVPQINNQNPVKVIVNGENVDYKYQAGVLEITKTEEAKENNWNSQNTYNVTYIYNAQSDSEKITTQATAEVTTIKNQTVQGATLENEYDVKEQKGSLVDVFAEGTNSLNKGYMYTSSKKDENKIDTKYNETYKIDIGYADVLDKIEIAQADARFVDENDETLKGASENIKINKVSINTDELKDILGEDGSIKLIDDDENEIAVLNKDRLEVQIDTKKIKLETTKPQKEGEITVTIEKSIIGNGNSSKDEIQSFKKLITTLESKGYAGNEEISKTTTNREVTLEEPTSKASLEVSTNRLSTVVKNENVVFNMTLNKNDISDMLYTNPMLKIRLPEEVTGIEITSAKVLYEEEINAGSIEINGNEISIKLEGNQTTYNTSTTTQGTLIRLETNLTLNNLAPSDTKSVELEYTNEFTGETNKLEKQFNIVAPIGFVTTNTISVNGQTSTAVENDQELIKIKTNESAKTMEVSANLINNLGFTANELTIVGRIPTAGNKTIGGVDLQSSMNTALSSAVETTGLDDATIYYSNNIEEAIDGTNWGLEATTDTKSFKIVENTPFENKQGATFKYTVTVPENLDYEKDAKESFGIFYLNDAQEGISRNLVESKVVGITTGKAPEMKVDLSAIDTNEGFEIKNNGNVTEGEYITYRAKILNTGSEDAHDVKINVSLPEGLSLVSYEQGSGEVGSKYSIDNKTKNIQRDIELLKGGENVTLEFNAKVTQTISSVTYDMGEGKVGGIDSEGNETSEEEAKQIAINVDVDSDILEESQKAEFKVNNTEGTLNIKLAANPRQTVSQDGEIQYILMISNSNYKDKNNIVAKLKLPEEVKYESTASGQETKYDESTNTVTVNIDNIAGLNNAYITVNAKSTASEDKLLKAQATLTCEELNSEIKSNIAEIYSGETSNLIKVKQTTNISSSITDKDKLEIFIDIENASSKEQKVNIRDDIQQELAVENYIITIEGQPVVEARTNHIDNQITIPAGMKAKVTIVTKPNSQTEGTTVNIENTPIITDSKNENIDVNSISVKVTGTEEVLAEVNEQQEEGKPEEKVSTYRIAGTAWLDENKDSIKENEEAKLPGMQLYLYNSQTKQYVVDSEGKVLVAATDENGEYIFSNVKSGEYIVIAEYNSENYQTASYKLDSAEDSASSKFIPTKLEERNVLTTDVIKVIDGNVYNINLGLVEKDKFDLEIANTVSKITVTNTASGKKEYTFNEEDDKVKVNSEDVKNSTMLVEYNIKVTNAGNVAGYAKTITNCMPQGMTFNSELNKDWYLAKDGNLYTVSLANQKLEPGESKDIKLVLVKTVSDTEIGIIRGKTEILTTYNEKGLEELNALSANTSATDLVILNKSNLTELTIIGICLGLMAVTTLTGYGVKKHLDKTYNIEM